MPLMELKATRENLPVERLEVLYAEKLAERITQQLEIEDEFKQLPVEDSMILRAYYIGGKTWQDVADTFGVDVRTVHRKHKKILEKLSV